MQTMTEATQNVSDATERARGRMSTDVVVREERMQDRGAAIRRRFEDDTKGCTDSPTSKAKMRQGPGQGLSSRRGEIGPCNYVSPVGGGHWGVESRKRMRGDYSTIARSLTSQIRGVD